MFKDPVPHGVCMCPSLHYRLAQLDESVPCLVLKLNTIDDFCKNDKSEGLIAGTLMSIQEKKSAKGTPYAILKLSDLEGEFELFLFSDILISNREEYGGWQISKLRFFIEVMMWRP